MSNRKLETTFAVDFAVHNPTTGTLVAPDTGPTVSVYEDLTNTPILTPAAAVRNAITGTYKTPIAATPRTVLNWENLITSSPIMASPGRRELTRRR